MAKNNEIILQIKVNDAQLKQLGLQSKKTAKDVDSVGRSAHSADRQLKGAAKASSNTTKNFSKMSQGINGGLVPAYATFAASVFALGAAFRGLEASANFRILLEGQKAFGEATGLAMRNIAKSVQMATEAQITYSEASQAAAIASAAGFSADDINRLGKAATNVSKVLGRDVTDSFNRLVRGVTKAEPELLDELGIILRLEIAQNKYAAATGKVASKLTIFEKQQAVLNEVLTQAETKYEAVAEKIKPNTFTKMAVALEGVVDAIKPFVDSILAPFADLLSKNVGFAIAAVMLFVSSILNQVVPAYDEWMEKSREQSKVTKEAAKLASDNAKLHFKAMFGGAGAGGGVTGVKDLLGGQQLEGKSQLAQFSRGEIDTLSDKARANISSQIKRNVGIFKGMSDEMKMKWTTTLEKMKVDSIRNTNIIKRTFNTIGHAWAAVTSKMVAMWEGAMGMITAIGRGAMMALNKAMGLLGIIGMIAALIGMLKQGYDWIQKMFSPESVIRFREEVKKVKDEFKSFNEEFMKIGAAFSSQFVDFSTGGDAMIFLGKAIDSIPIKRLEDALLLSDKYAPVNKDLYESYSEMITGLTKLNPLFAAFNISANQRNIALEKQVKSLKPYLEYYSKLGKINQEQASNLEKLNRLEAEGMFKEDSMLQAARIYGQIAYAEKQAADQAALIAKQKGLTAYQLKKIAERQKQDEDSSRKNLKLAQDILGVFKQQTQVKAEQLVIETQLRIASKFSNKILANNLKIRQLENKIMEESAKLEIDKLKYAKSNDLTLKNQLAIREKQIELQQIELEMEKSLLNYREQFIRTAGSATQTEMGDAFYNAIIGKETSLRDALLNMAQGVGDALAKKISEQMAEQATSFLSNIPGLGFLKDPQEQLMDRVQIVQDQLLSIIEQQAAKEEKFIESGGEVGEALNKLRDELPKVFTSGSTEFKDAIIEASKIGSQMYWQAIQGSQKPDPTNLQDTALDALKNKKDVGTAVGDAAKNNALLEGKTEAEATLIGSIAKTDIDQKLGGNIMSTAGSMSDIGSLLSNNKLGAINAQDVLANTLTSEIDKGSDLWSMISGMFGSPFGSMFGGLFGMAKGGIMGYESGGVASDPTYIVGEGKNYEAVVPLPDNRSIPVKMNGNQGTNNVSVNVNMDGSSSTTATGDDAAAFGAAVSAAVQEEIQKQTRPGGILNRGKG